MFHRTLFSRGSEADLPPLSPSAERRRRAGRLVAVYASITLLAILLALSYQLFIVENHFAPAGISGVAMMVQYRTGFSLGYMSLLINIPLCVLAFLLINRRFALRSSVFCLAYSLSFLVFQRLGLQEFQYNAHGQDTVFPALLSGIVSGFVYGVCFRMDSSTAGVDIIAKFVSARRPRVNFFWMTFALNVAVAAVSFFVYAEPGADGRLVYDYRPVCLCLLYSFLSSSIGDAILKGTRTALKFTIVTSRPDEIVNEVFSRLRHGVTRLPATGSFSHEEKTVLICVVNRHQIAAFREILRKYEDTFAFSESVNETYGIFLR